MLVVVVVVAAVMLRCETSSESIERESGGRSVGLCRRGLLVLLRQRVNE